MAGSETEVRPGRVLDVLTFSVLWIPYALLAHRFLFITDDAYISFRYSKNWAQGLGLAYNPGETLPVEGYSNFLWVVIGAIIESFQADITFWLPLLSFLCGTGLLWLVFDTLRRRCELDRKLASVGTLFLGCFPPFATYSTSGLETMPYAFLLFLTFERLVLRRGGMDGVGAGVAALALALMRVEGVGWAFALIPLAAGSRWLAKEKLRRPLLWYVGIVGVGYGIYYACRYAYFETIFPNTVYVKAGLSWARLVRGSDYVVVYLLTFLTPLVIIPAGLVALRRSRLAVGGPVAAVAMGTYAYSILVGGDFMTMGRFLVPGLPFAAFLFVWLLEEITGRSRRRRRWVLAGGLAVVLIGLAPAWDLHLVPEAARSRFHFRHNLARFWSEYEQWLFQKNNAVGWARRGQALKAYAKPGETLVAETIGAVGYYSDLFIYDQSGLVNREVARRPVRDEILSTPGHDKMVSVGFFLKYKPTYLSAVLSESVSRDFLVRMVLIKGSELKARRLEREYVPAFSWTRLVNAEGVPVYLIVLKRIPPGVTAAEAWEAHERDVAALVQGAL